MMLDFMDFQDRGGDFMDFMEKEVCFRHASFSFARGGGGGSGPLAGREGRGSGGLPPGWTR